jgi:hypothetical protein
MWTMLPQSRPCHSHEYLSGMSQGNPTSAPADEELTAVRRAFDAAYQRMVECAKPEELRDELSNMLQHHYRLSELRKTRWKAANQNFTNRDFEARVCQVPGTLGARWIRTYDTHDIAKLSDQADVYSNVYTAMYGVLVWKLAADMPFINVPTDPAPYADYRANLENRPVLDSMRAAFDGLVVLP